MANAVWPALLACKEFLAAPDAGSTPCVYFSRPNGTWRFATVLPTSIDPGPVLAVPLDGSVSHTASGVDMFVVEKLDRGEDPFVLLPGSILDPEVRTFFRIYLPLLIGGHRARRAGEVFVTAHIAQTLDGRIACRNGHSQWISNHANLVHAHRLRALHDAVMIGGRTVAVDNPRLTVRHVEGRDPARVILSATASVLKLPADRHVFKDAGSTVICRPDALSRVRLNGDHEAVDVIRASVSPERWIAPGEIRDILAGRGQHAVFLEGGASTLSCFLERRMIDVLHVHVAPMILGSGVNSFTLPEVQSVRDGRLFEMEHFAMDGEVMFECRCRPEE